MRRGVEVVLLLAGCVSGCTLFGKHTMATGMDGGLDAKAPGPDGGGVPEGGVPESGAAEGGDDAGLSPGALAFLSELDVYKNGGKIPAAGLMGEVTVTVNPDGSHTVSMAGTNGHERLHIDRQPSGAFTLTADVNGDGKVDSQMTKTISGSTATTVWELDDNLNGKFNWRATMSYGHDVNTVAAKLEQTPFGGTNLVETAAYSGAVATAAACQGKSPAEVMMGGSCDANGAGAMAPKPNFCQPPTPGTGSSGGGCFWPGGTDTWASADVRPIRIGGTNFFKITQGAMRCSDEQYRTIELALYAAWADFDANVVKGLEPSWASVTDAIANRSIYYGCALPSCLPSGVVAATHAAYFADLPRADAVVITTIAPFILQKGEGATEEIIIHEWFHPDLDHIPDQNGANARDRIYGCSRVAAGVKSWNAGLYLGQCCDASSARDHAMCAQDPARKEKFGVQDIFRETADGYVEQPNGSFTGYTDKPMPPTCVQDMGTSTAVCSCYLEQVPAYCDQTVLTQSAALGLGLLEASGSLTLPNCCETCPGSTPIAGIGRCGTYSPGTQCPPKTTCGQLPSNGGIASGPTPQWRQFPAAEEAGQAKAPYAMGSTGNCAPVAGFPY